MGFVKDDIYILILGAFLFSGCSSFNSFAFISLTQMDDLLVDERVEGVFRPRPGMMLPYTISISSNRGESNLLVNDVAIRLYDNKDDGVYYVNHLLEQRIQDVNNDGYMDFVLTGEAIMSAEDKLGSVTKRPIRSVFIFDPVTMSFTNSVPDVAVPVCRVTKRVERGSTKEANKIHLK